jgi:hypothetical protein
VAATRSQDYHSTVTTYRFSEDVQHVLQAQFERAAEREAAAAAREDALCQRELEADATAAALDAREAKVNAKVRDVLGDAEARLARACAGEAALAVDRVCAATWPQLCWA